MSCFIANISPCRNGDILYEDRSCQHDSLSEPASKRQINLTALTRKQKLQKSSSFQIGFGVIALHSET